jgi:Leucine-rich repeat (LRR) protein
MPDFETAAATLARVQPHLEAIAVSGSELRPEHIAALKPFRRLTRLDLLANSPQPGSMEALAQLPAVENIRSLSAEFSDLHLAALSHCSQIKSLDLSNTSITDKGISKLRSLKELRILRASAKISDSAAKRLKNAVPGLMLYK